MILEKNNYYYSFDHDNGWFAIFRFIRQCDVYDTKRCMVDMINTTSKEFSRCKMICYKDSDRTCRLATPEEISYFLLCQKENIKVNRPIIEEIYQIY